MLGSAAPGEDLATVTVRRDDHGYGMKVSGDNPVYVQSVKEGGAAWRAGLRPGDRILRVDGVPAHRHSHQQVVHMIRANPSTVLTVHQTQRQKTPITAPLPVNSEKRRQLEFTKLRTYRMMLEQERLHVADLENELAKVPDERKQAALESALQRCAKLRQELDSLRHSQPPADEAPSTPKLSSRAKSTDKASPPPHTSFLAGLPRSLSNLTGQSLRGLRARQPRPETTPLLRQHSDERHSHTVPLVPTTCLDNGAPPPPLPPRAPGRLAQSAPAARPERTSDQRRGSVVDAPLPNSMAMQMSYPLVNAPPPPLQTDCTASSAPVLHVRSQSSPEHLDLSLTKNAGQPRPPGTPPPPYALPAPHRDILSMEDEDDLTSDTSLFASMQSVRESRARTAVMLNWLIGEQRPATCLLALVLADAYRAAAAAPHTRRRWAYELLSTFLMPHAPLHLEGVDENMANEIEHVLSTEWESEERLRAVFSRAAGVALAGCRGALAQLELKRRAGLAGLHAPPDAALRAADADRAQEQAIVERLFGQMLSLAPPAPPGVPAAGTPAGPGAAGAAGGAGAALSAALLAAAQALGCRPSVVAGWAGPRAALLQRDKQYKLRLKALAKAQPQPYVVRGHHLRLTALTSLAHCHACELVASGAAPQAYLCSDCNLRVHVGCARNIEESCCLDGEHHNNRISRFMERIQANGPEAEKKSRKTSATSHFLNMERSFRKAEEEETAAERRDESDESLYESADGDAVSAGDDATLRLETPAASKESLKLAVTDEETDVIRSKKGHRKALSLSNPLELVKSLDWLDTAKKELDKNSDKKKSRESLWSEEEKDSKDTSTVKTVRLKVDKKEEKPIEKKPTLSDQAKTRKTSKASSVTLSLFRRKKPPSATVKAVEAVTETLDKIISGEEILNCTRFFIEEEKRHSDSCENRMSDDSGTEDEAPKPKTEHRRRLSRQTSRGKSKVRGKSQSVKVNTLRKSHSGTLKKNKKKPIKTPTLNRSRQASVVDAPQNKKNTTEVSKQTAWIFAKGEARREGSAEETAADADVDVSDHKELIEKDTGWRAAPPSGRGVNRAESCRERDAPRRGKHRNASDPNRLTAHTRHDLEPGAPAPSHSSSSSSLSSRSNESGAGDTQSDWSEEEEPLAPQWTDSLPPRAPALALPPRLRKRQEVIHELIVSEGSHVRWLKVLSKIFLRPLEAQPQLLPAEELRALFPNLPAVRERHQRLYAALRAVRAASAGRAVAVRPVADAVLSALGEPGYAACLARFCRNQRSALDTLRERRRKNKELHAFLANRERQPLCARLQLRDLLACVWQRLTKYQLLLESVAATMPAAGAAGGGGSGAEGADDAAAGADGADEGGGAEAAERLRLALATAKEVLHTVDTQIRTHENQQRLKHIQSKLEVRCPAAAEWEPVRRLSLAGRALRHEGELALRTDNKRLPLQALLLDDTLVLLHREGDRFVLRPLPAGQGPLSPVIRWDKVLFRANAAVRCAFFLMNINGVQMHELVAAPADYATWVKHIQEAPLARLSDLKPAAPRAPEDNNGTAVSRNPSDASSQSSSSAAPPDTEDEGAAGAAAGVADPPAGAAEGVEGAAEGAAALALEVKDGEEEREETPRAVRQAGRITWHTDCGAELAAAAAAGDVRVAELAVSPQESLRRLDAVIESALAAKSAALASLLGTGRGGAGLRALADLAAAEARGDVDVSAELGEASCDEEPSVHQLILTAYGQASQLTEQLRAALSLSERGRVRAERRRGDCARCARAPSPPAPSAPPVPPTTAPSAPATAPAAPAEHPALAAARDERDRIYADDERAAWRLARSLLPLAAGLQRCVSGLAAALPVAAHDSAEDADGARGEQEHRSNGG